MRQLFFLLLVCFAGIQANAIDITGTFISSFYHRFYQNTTISVEADGNNVKIYNLFNYGKTVTGTYDENAMTITIPVGQVIRSTSTRDYVFYTYTKDESDNRVIDYSSDLVFNIEQYSSYNSFKTEQDVIIVYSEDHEKVSTNFTSISYRNYQNAIVSTEYFTSPTGVITTEEYPVNVELLGDGRYLIRNFDQRGRLYLNTHREGLTFTTETDYPLVYTVNLQNYFYPVACEESNGSMKVYYNSAINGSVKDKQITFDDMWVLGCDNTDNTDVAEGYRNKYVTGNGYHKNSTITLTDTEMRFLFPHTTHEVVNTENILMTQANFESAYEEGWMWSGYGKDDKLVNEITNKTSTVEAFTDNIISKANVVGLDIKNQDNGKKNIYMRVKGISSIKYYVTSNASGARVALVTATPNEGEAITKSLESNSNGAVGQIDNLDVNATYTIEFYTEDSDMILYAVQLLPTSTGIMNVDVDETVDSRAAIYDLQGRRLDSKPTKGVYIINGEKVVLK